MWERAPKVGGKLKISVVARGEDSAGSTRALGKEESGGEQIQFVQA
jgi:hypothetical protein